MPQSDLFATMSASGKLVEVLCPNGRRVKVKTTPSMTVLQVLQEVCQKQSYTDTEFDLKHQRKVLNVTSLMRFLNLPNNAKLELVKCEKARTLSNVTVAIQLEDGTRYQDDFNPDSSLLSVLKTFVTDIENMENADLEPVCMYMRNEYKGVRSLSMTSLKSIGVTSGRVAFRLHFRPREKESQPMECEDRPSTSQKGAISDRKPTHNDMEGNRKKLKLGGDEMELSTTNDISGHMQPPSVPLAEVTRPISSEGVAYMSHSILGPPPRQIFPDDVGQDKKEEVPLPPVKPVTYEFADFKFPDQPCEDQDDMAIDPQLVKKEVKMSIPCDRQAIVFTMEKRTSNLPLNGQDPDDSFFQVTIDDLRKRMSDLKSERKGMEEGELLTSRLREIRKIERASNFDMIPVRIVLPGEIIVQGIFRPLETVGVIKQFLEDFLSSPIMKYELFVTPPRIVLKDNNQTLYDAKLFPAAVIHVSFGTSTLGPHLKQQFFDNLKTAEEAEEVVDKILKRKQMSSNASISNAVNPPSHSSYQSTSRSNGASGHAEFSDGPSTSSGISNSFPKTVAPKGAPKWFKTGR